LTVNETLSVQTPHAGVVVLQLNRPERLNAINHVMVGELKETLGAVSADTSVHAVVITGAGRGFCSGIDMRDFGPAIPEATAPAIDADELRGDLDDFTDQEVRDPFEGTGL